MPGPIHKARKKASAKDEYNTPKWVTDPLGPFDLDPCAGDQKIATVNYNIYEYQNGLLLPWFGLVWCNPPFSEKEAWIDRLETHNNAIALFPDSSASPWYQRCADHCGWVFTFGKKPDFGNGSSYAPMNSALFPYGEEALDRISESKLPGLLLKVQKYTPRTPRIARSIQLAINLL